MTTLTKHDRQVRAYTRNAVYVAYANAHGRSVADQLTHDAGSSSPFHAWVTHQKQRFAVDHPEAVSRFNGTVTKLDVWFRWLATQFSPAAG